MGIYSRGYSSENVGGNPALLKKCRVALQVSTKQQLTRLNDELKLLCV